MLLKKDMQKIEMKIKIMENEYKECVKALKDETHARTKAEETAKVLKEIVESVKEKGTTKTKDNDPKDVKEMEIDDATGVWIQQQKKRSLKINKEKQPNKTFKCENCEEIFHNQNGIEEHMKTHTLKDGHSCQKCKESFKTQEMLEKHKIQEHTESTIHMCNECKLTFESKQMLDNHIVEHKEAHHKCKYCNISFNNVNKLEEHTKSHSKMDDLICEKCGISCNEQDELVNHRRSHVQDKPEAEIKCNKCEKVYSNMSKLRRHDWRSHRTVKCNICGSSLESREEISNHRKVEHRMSRKTKCRYFPNCIDENECFFVHNENEENQLDDRNVKSRYCLKGENCADQSCEYSEVNHLNVKNVMCRFQERCNKPECMFKHMVERASFLAACTQNSKKK